MADVIGPVELSAALQLAVYVVVVHGVRHDVQLQLPVAGDLGEHVGKIGLRAPSWQVVTPCSR